MDAGVVPSSQSISPVWVSDVPASLNDTDALTVDPTPTGDAVTVKPLNAGATLPTVSRATLSTGGLTPSETASVAATDALSVHSTVGASVLVAPKVHALGGAPVTTNVHHARTHGAVHRQR